MKAQGLDPHEVDAVAISHLHGDHFGGLPFLILDGQFARRTKPLTVLGPAGTEARLLALMEACYPSSTSVRRKFDVEVVELAGAGSRYQVGPLSVGSWVVDHASGAPALALNARSGSSTFGYSGDTAWTPTLIAAARDTDVFACEAYTYDRTVRYHLAYPTVLEHEQDFETGRLVLTHMGPSVLEQLDTIELTTAHDGLTLSI